MPFGESMTATEQFLAFLETQRAAFRAELPGKVEEMSALWDGIVCGGVGTAAISDLERLAHSLAGSGATFGFARLSTAARALENAVQGLRFPPPPCESRLDVTTALTQVRRCLP